MKRVKRLIKEFSLRRPKAREWLLVRPSDTEGTADWQWLHYAAGATPDTGAWPPPERYRNLPTALVVPATRCSHFHLPAPPGLKRQEWPQLLEEQLLQPAETLHIGCIARDGRRLELVAVERLAVMHWQDECEALGLRLSRCWAELQLLSEAPAGQAVHWQRAHDLCLTYTHDDQTRRWLVWPTLFGELPPAWRHDAQQVFEGAWPPVAEQLDTLPSLLDLRPVRSVRQSSIDLSISQGQRRLIAACALLALGWGALWLGQDWQQGADSRARVIQAIGPTATPQQAARTLAALERQRAEHALRQQRLTSLEHSVSQWLDRERGWQLHSSRFDGQRWFLTLAGPGPLPALQPWQAMAEDVAAEVTLAAAESVTGFQLAFNLGEAQ
jgi:general secretion pathway protein L